MHFARAVIDAEAADLVELVFDTLKGTLAQGQKIKISGFGNFVVREKRARVGRNPQTGESIEITARRVLTFRPSQVLRAEVNAALEGKVTNQLSLNVRFEYDYDRAVPEVDLRGDQRLITSLGYAW